jgi:GNAT superfamily N-acetyltransferase
MEIRSAEPADLVHIGAIDVAGDALFAAIGYQPLPQSDEPEDHCDAAVLLVAGRPPVGFAAVTVIDGLAHLAQVSVLPAFGRRGIGGALVEQACRWAVGAGHQAVTLNTFREVPWNAPFYARLGFREVAPSGELRALRDAERRIGLDALGPRITMRREL